MDPALTTALAIYGAIVSTGSGIAGIVALVQSRSQFGRPHWESEIGAAWNAANGRAQMSWLLVNYGPREAVEVTLYMRAPHHRLTLREWLTWRGVLKGTGPFIPFWLMRIDAVAPMERTLIEIDPRYGHLAVSPDSPGWAQSAGEPMYGKWRFRYEWRAVPNMSKVHRVYQSLRIGRDFKTKHPVLDI